MTRIMQFTMETLDAIKALAKKDRWLQALIVLYSAIDTLAWANKPSGDVKGEDFCSWVGTYMKSEETLGCTPEELYGARCGLVHSGAAESSLSRKGRARQIWYATAAKTVATLEAAIANQGAPAKAVCTTNLIERFAEGTTSFIDELERDRERQQQAVDRIAQWMAFLPAAPVVEALRSESEG